MNYKSLKIFLVFILLLLLNHSFAQTSDSSDSGGATPIQDSVQFSQDDVGDTIVSKMIFDNSGDSIAKWKKDPGFVYMAYIDSILKKKKGDLKMDTMNVGGGGRSSTRSISVSSSNGSFLNSTPIKIFFWILAIFFILFILYRLFFKGGLFQRGSTRTPDTTVNEEHEELSEYSTYNNMITDAERNNDLNLAVRYLYLQALKKLSDSELINFSPDKTNDKYVKELAGKNYQSSFASLTTNYEYIWYGKFSISRSSYDSLKNEFNVFNNKI